MYRTNKHILDSTLFCTLRTVFFFFFFFGWIWRIPTHRRNKCKKSWTWKKLIGQTEISTTKNINKNAHQIFYSQFWFQQVAVSEWVIVTKRKTVEMNQKKHRRRKPLTKRTQNLFFMNERYTNIDNKFVKSHPWTELFRTIYKLYDSIWSVFILQLIKIENKNIIIKIFRQFFVFCFVFFFIFIFKISIKCAEPIWE